MENGSGGWFGVRCIFRWTAEPGVNFAYEERITIWRASGIDDALARAEREAASYLTDASASGPQEYLGLAQAYRFSWDHHEALDAVEGLDQRADGLEVFSMIRTSDLPPDEYLTRFFDTGAENNSPLDNR